ncbi:MAG: GtrA family protein [Verrucomicrobiales bacterium]|nr:GtrA family protein [Verrucomicrobiales bacterium]
MKENDKKTVVKHVLSHDAHPLIQFGKYVTCGVMAVMIHLSVTYTLGLTIFPAIGQHLSDHVKEINGYINNTIAFFISGCVVYWLNIKFVFKSGKHHVFLEIFLFFAVSALPLAAGLGMNWFIFHNTPLLEQWEIAEYVEHIANFGFVLASALVNFVARKFIIFKG